MKLISYDEAVARLVKLTSGREVRDSEECSLHDAMGRALAEEIVAVKPNPRFDNSAVDGYCLFSEAALVSGSFLKVIGQAAAGKSFLSSATPDETVRIFTGARIPDGCIAVAMQEDVIAGDGGVELTSTCAIGASIRRQGTDFQAGDVLLEMGATINAGSIGLLASQGLASVQVVRRLRVAILVTGDELSGAADDSIHDSNGPMLRSQVGADGHDIALVEQVPDSEEALTSCLERAAPACDVILVSGGASVGDYDYLHRVVEVLGEIEFHGVKVRPGKPVMAGTIGQSLVVGLPGNPASAFVCYQIFARDALWKLAGHLGSRGTWLRVQYLPAAPQDMREEFVRCTLSMIDGRLVANAAHVQGSFGLRSLGAAQVLVRVPPDASDTDVFDALLL